MMVVVVASKGGCICRRGGQQQEGKGRRLGGREVDMRAHQGVLCCAVCVSVGGVMCGYWLMRGEGRQGRKEYLTLIYGCEEG